MKDIIVKTITSVEEFRMLHADWDNLLKESNHQSAFLSWEMLFTWWCHYGTPNSLRIFEARIEGTLVGIAPLMLITRKKRGLGFRILQNIGTPHIDVGGFLVKENSEEILKKICFSILELSETWDLLELNEFQKNSLQSKSILDFFTNSKHRFRIKINQHFYLPIDGEWEVFFQSLSKNLRKDVNRRIRRAEETAKVKFERVQGSNITNSHLELLFNINQKGNFPNLYKSEVDQSFHLALLKAFHDKGIIDIHIMYLGDIPVAFQYGFLFNNRYEDWWGAIDLKYHSLSVGKLLLYQTLKTRFLEKNYEVDFLRGTQSYKEEWDPKSREYIQIKVTNPRRFLAFLSFILLPEIKQNPLSDKFIVSVQTSLRSFFSWGGSFPSFYNLIAITIDSMI